MANAYITNTSRFKPFSFQEMLQPYAIYTDAYNKVESEMADLDLLAEDVASKLNNPLDKGLQQQALAFQEDLKSTMNDLYDKGLTPETRKKLNTLKATYSRDLNPINDAYKAYQEDQKYLAKMAVEHPEILIEGAGKSLSDYMGGKSPKMISVNSDDLMNQAMAMAKTQAGRTYRQSGWYNTADGKFLERTTETGLNDVDFNNAMAIIQNPNLTAKDLGMTDKQFARVKNNAGLIETSMQDIINNPSFASLSTANKQRALNSIIKGVRAGFQYDRKTETNSDPDYAYKLKAVADKKAKADRIGSDYFYTPDTTRQKYKNTFIKTLGKDIGSLKERYASYFDGDVLKSTEQIEKEAAKMKADTPRWNTTQSSTIQFNPVTMGGGSDSYRKDYKEFVQAVVDLGLDPNTVTKDQFMKALEGDVKGRKRLSITSNDAGFEKIQARIEDGLKNREYVDTIIGLEQSSLGKMGNYRTEQTVRYKDLLDKNGKLKMLGVTEDPATGQLSAKIKTPKGEYMEILLPDGVGYQADDASDLRRAALSYSAVASGYHPIIGYDDSGKPVIKYEPLDNGYLPGTNILGTDYLDTLLEDKKIMLGNLLNFFGPEDVND